MNARTSEISIAATHIVFLLALSGGLLLPVAPALACSCIVPKPPQESLQEAAVVFSGRVVRVEAAVFSSSSLDPVTVTFAVDRWWKGPGTQRVTMKTAREGASCGYRFAEGSEYLVYAYASGDGNDLRVSSCSRTSPLASAGDDIAALGEVTPPFRPAVDTPDVFPDFPPTSGSIAALSVGIVLAVRLSTGSSESVSRRRRYFPQWLAR